MMNRRLPRGTKSSLSGALIVLAATASAFGQPQPFMQAGTGQPALLPAPMKAASPDTNAPTMTATNAVEQFFNGKIPEVIADGKFNLDVRLRYEQFDEEGVKAITKGSYAPTIRTRFGYTTASLYGFQGMLEGVNVSAIGPEHNYNAAGSNGQADRPIVPDAPLTRLDQDWVGYSYTNWISVKAGQQVINLDDQRFVGNSGWWQNMQTFDAATAKSEPIKDLDILYSYIWHVHRIYGNISGLSAANTDFDSRSHLINVSYSGWDYGRFVGYAYLLDLKNAAGAANSSATYGGYFAGNAPISDGIAVDYRAEYAWQTDYGDSLLRYGADYYNLEGGANIKPLAFGGGDETLGSAANTGAAGGRASVRTPLATLHPFDGWANSFLTTPGDGLRDFYGYAQVTLPEKIPLRFVYHKFDADFGGGDYGQEVDLLVSHKFGKYWNALVEYAYYHGQNAAAPSLTVANVDMQKIWAQVEFDF